VIFLAGEYVGLLGRWLDSEETMPSPDGGALLRRWSFRTNFDSDAQLENNEG